MSGGLVVLPLDLQIVRGSSPAGAGLQPIPLMVGILLTSVLAGRVMSRTGRYKALPVVDTALMLTALLLVSTLRVDTPIERAMLYSSSRGRAWACRCRRSSSTSRTPCRRRTWASPPRR